MMPNEFGIYKLSVLLPVYNGIANYPNEGYLRDSIMSILHLGMSIDLELIVINDGSTDDTFRHSMRIWETVPNMRVINLMTNQGQAAALNVGVEAACGTYLWQWSVRARAHRGAEVLVRALDDDPTVGFAYGQMKSVGGDHDYIHRPPRVFDREAMLQHYRCNFYMYRRYPGLKYVEQVVLPDGRTIGICDRDMSMQIMEKGGVGSPHPEALCVTYYNTGRHTMHEVTDNREEVEQKFRKRWDHLL